MAYAITSVRNKIMQGGNLGDRLWTFQGTYFRLLRNPDRLGWRNFRFGSSLAFGHAIGSAARSRGVDVRSDASKASASSSGTALSRGASTNLARHRGAIWMGRKSG